MPTTNNENSHILSKQKNYHLPKSLFQERINGLLEILKQRQIQAAFIFTPVNLFYYTGSMSDGFLYVTSEAKICLLVRKSLARTAYESPISAESIISFRSLKQIPELIKKASTNSLDSIGLELNQIPAHIYLTLAELFKKSNFVNISDEIRRQRAVKSDWEINWLEKAGEHLAEAFRRIPELFHSGMREIDLSAELEKILRILGSPGLIRNHKFGQEIFYGPLVSGANAACPVTFSGPVGSSGLYPGNPHGAGFDLIQPNKTLLIDFVTSVNGYHCDMSRTFYVSENSQENPTIPSRIQTAYEFILELNVEIENLLKPGQICSEIYNFALEKVRCTKYTDFFMGYGENQVNFIGHGVGLELDELPVIHPKSQEILKPGMTIAIEPKIIFPDLGGIGLENTYLITNFEAKKLTPTPEELIMLS